MKNLTKRDETLNQEEINLVGVNTIELSVTNKTNEIVAIPGNIITFELQDHEDNETDVYTLKLVDHQKSSEDEVSIYSPIGKNIYKAYVGETKNYTLNNRNFTIKILDIRTAV